MGGQARPQGLLVDAATGRSPVCAKLAWTIRELRQRAGLSQERLAALAHVGRRTIGSIESGERVPTIEVVERIANGLGLAVDELVFLAGRRAARAGEQVVCAIMGTIVP